MKRKWGRNKLIVFLLAIAFLFSLNLVYSLPVYPDDLDYGNNETKGSASALFVNVSKGYISNFNLSATVQNTRWKAFVGQIVGSTTLDDSTGSTIYDWTFASLTGRVYATRKVAAVTWASIACATPVNLESENTAMVLTNEDDNITATFSDTTHDSFPVAAANIGQDSCPTLNTYRNGVKTQDAGQPFEEMVLYDGSNLVFATIIEEDATGFNGENYDFQMIVPENGTGGFNGATPYYLYLELGN